MMLFKQDIRSSYAVHASNTWEERSGVSTITKITPLRKLKIFRKLGAKQRTFSPRVAAAATLLSSFRIKIYVY